MAMHGLTLVINHRVNEDFERYCEEVEIRIVPPVCPVRVSPFDFSSTDQLIDDAYRGTVQRLENGGLEQNEVPHELLPHEH